MCASAAAVGAIHKAAELLLAVAASHAGRPALRSGRPLPHHVIPHAPPQVPLMWTVYLQLAFRHFVLLGPRDEARQPGFFEVRGLITT